MPANIQYHGTRQKVLNYLMQREGRQVTSVEIATAIGVPSVPTRNTCTSLVRERGTGVECPTPGVFMFRQPEPVTAPTQPAGRLFEEIGIGRDGRIIIQDEEGNFYLASPIG